MAVVACRVLFVKKQQNKVKLGFKSRVKMGFNSMLLLLLPSIYLKLSAPGYSISSLCLREKKVSHIFQCLQACCCYIYWKSVVTCRVGTLPIAGGASARLTGPGLMDTQREVYVSKYLLIFQKISSSKAPDLLRHGTYTQRWFQWLHWSVILACALLKCPNIEYRE